MGLVEKPKTTSKEYKKLYNQKYRSMNPEKIKEIQQRFRDKWKEDLKKRNAEYKKENKDKVNEYQRKYYAEKSLANKLVEYEHILVDIMERVKSLENTGK